MATVTFKRGSPVTLLGNEVKAGQAAPDFKVQKSADMELHTLVNAGGKTRIIATVPSLDTPVCDLETSGSREASKLCPTSRSSVSAWTCRSRRSAGAALRMSIRW